MEGIWNHVDISELWYHSYSTYLQTHCYMRKISPHLKFVVIGAYTIMIHLLSVPLASTEKQLVVNLQGLCLSSLNYAPSPHFAHTCFSESFQHIPHWVGSGTQP